MKLGELLEQYLDMREQLSWERSKSTPSQAECSHLEEQCKLLKETLDEWQPEAKS